MRSRERRAALRDDPLARLHRLHEIRRVEETVQELYGEGLIRGSAHTSQGQEAVAVALAVALDPADAVTCTYRGHHHALALGLTPDDVLAEILGRATGCVGGLGGSMHLCGPEVGLLPTFAIVGAGLPVAVGAALTAELTSSGAISAALFGDGTSNIGAFHESLNLAAVWNLPVMFVCENNLYGEYSPLAATTSVTDIADRADAYGMRSTVVDGQDLVSLTERLESIAGEVRTTRRPHLVEVKTYRYVGHSRSDPATYRPPGELDQWLARDPLDLYARHLVDTGVVTPDGVAQIVATVHDEVEQAAARAVAAPPPDVGDMFRYVSAGYAPGSASEQVAS